MPVITSYTKQLPATHRWWQKDLPPPSPADFHNRTLADIAAWRRCVAAKGRPACVRGYQPQQLVKGMYSEFLQVCALSSCRCVSCVFWGFEQLCVRGGVGERGGAGSHATELSSSRVVKVFTPTVSHSDGTNHTSRQDWLAHWPRSQLLILRYEDYVTAPEPHLRAALTHLGVTNPDKDGALAAAAAAPVKNRAANKRQAMLPETRQLLTEFYGEFNGRLAAALGGDARWLWRPGERGGAGGGGG